MGTSLNSSMVTIGGSSLTTPLMEILEADEIEPGADPSYQLCKLIYLYHPLGAKMTEAPIAKAQSQERKITVQNAPEDVPKEFIAERLRLGADELIKNVGTLSRVFGVSSIVLGCEGKPTNVPLDMEKIWQEKIFFNVLDPLNTSGSLVLNQIPTSATFNKPVTVSTNGQTYHRSRAQILMNGQPIYIAYTSSGFGYVGRSVYQRALFPLKSFLRTMKADDLIATKLALLIAKQKQPGSVLDEMMGKLLRRKSALLKEAQTGNVLSIDLEEAIETLDMQNTDGAGTFSRTNILKNVATSADMPAVMLENETLTEGFGEGTEDAKIIAEFADGIRRWLHGVYAWIDHITMYRAWNPDFFARMQKVYPDLYGQRQYSDVFSEWRDSFAAEWPSLLKEPESEEIKVEAVKLEAIVAIVQTLFPQVDPSNQTELVKWLADNVSENKRLFQHELTLDLEALLGYLEDAQERKVKSEETETEATSAKLSKFDSASLRAALDRLPARRQPLRVLPSRK